MIKLLYPDFWKKRLLISYLLLPLSYVYIFLSFIRRLLSTRVKFDIPVICIGNATVGGSGKTQFVKWLVPKLEQSGKKCLIISKGYKGKFKKFELIDNNSSVELVGDEAKELSRIAPIIVTRSMSYVTSLIDTLSPDIIILDDWMQNPSTPKNVNILIINEERGFGNSFLFPAGPMREKLKDILTKIDIIISVTIGDKIKTYDPKIPTFKAIVSPMNQHTINQHYKYFAFTGIGNPEKFFNLLEKCEIKILGKKIFPNHHNYAHSDLNDLLSCLDNSNADMLITSEKDSVKIDSSFKLEVLKVKLNIDQEELLLKLINEKIQTNQVSY